MKSGLAVLMALAMACVGPSASAAAIEAITFGTSGNNRKELTTAQYRGWSFTLAEGVVGIEVTHLGLYCGGAHTDRLAYLSEQVDGAWFSRASVTVPADSSGSGMHYVELGAPYPITNANTWAVMGYYAVGEYYRETFTASVDSNLMLGDWYRDSDLSGTWMTTFRNVGGIFKFDEVPDGGGSDAVPEPVCLGLVGMVLLALRRRRS